MEAYIRMGNESVIAPSYVLNQLILKGMHRTYDELISEYDFKDYAFSKLRERYKSWTGNSMEEKLFDSFDMRDEHGKLTNAGALLADDSPIRHSRLFCTRWNGLDKSGVEDMRRYLLDLKAEGKTILIASHSTEDIQILCDCVFEMDKGTLSQIK